MDPVPVNYKSLSARRAWIEICHTNGECGPRPVALRKESVDRNRIGGARQMAVYVALRKESVDRNILNKELIINGKLSLSARRAWIEMQSCPYVHA